MNSRLNETEADEAEVKRVTGAGSTAQLAARAALVNRTHRVVHERAKTIQARRNKVRSLWVPMLVCSALVLILCTAIWTVLAEDDLIQTGVPDASQQILVLLVWFLPLSGALLAMVWFRRTRGNRERVDEEHGQ